jgi:hypothetical protein
MLLSTLRTPPKEEEERDRGGAVESKWEERGATEDEGTSMVMVGAVRF